MTTARDVLSRAIALLGYTDRYGAEDSETYVDLYHRATALINQAIADAAYLEGRELVEVASLDDEIQLSPRTVNDILPYSVAMFLALDEADMTQYSIYANLYSQKRASIPKPSKFVKMNHSPFSWGDYR